MVTGCKTATFPAVMIYSVYNSKSICRPHKISCEQAVVSCKQFGGEGNLVDLKVDQRLVNHSIKNTIIMA
jgi:hypothetical protein